MPTFTVTTTLAGSVFMGRKSFDLAFRSALTRSTKTEATIGVGTLVAMVDGGLLSIPASFLTRLGLDRSSAMKRMISSLNRRTADLNLLTS